MTDPVKSAAEGAAKGTVEGFLNWTKEQVEELARKFRDREIAFVEDKSTAETIKRQKDVSDYGFITRFLPRGHLRVLVSLGLALRQMEDNRQDVTQLKNSIYAQFGNIGVWVAELVQLGLVSQLLARLTKIYNNPKDVEKRLVAFLEQVDQLAIWISKRDMKNYRRFVDLVSSRVDTNPSQMVILLGKGDKASAAVLKVLSSLRKDSRGYMIQVDQSGSQLTAYIFSPEVKRRFTDRWDTFAKG